MLITRYLWCYVSTQVTTLEAGGCDHGLLPHRHRWYDSVCAVGQALKRCYRTRKSTAQTDSPARRNVGDRSPITTWNRTTPTQPASVVVQCYAYASNCECAKLAAPATTPPRSPSNQLGA